MRKNILIITICSFVLLTSCKDYMACTNEFRMITVVITGDSLTSYYTIRTSTNDTITYGLPINISNRLHYTILDDGYHESIRNTKESYRFIGFVRDTMILNEEYIIEADYCHINYVSGKQEIEL